MNNVNIYPTAWKGRHPRPETVRRWVGQRLACEKIQRQLFPPLLNPFSGFFNRLFPLSLFAQLSLLRKKKPVVVLKEKDMKAKARMRNRLASQSRRNNRGR